MRTIDADILNAGFEEDGHLSPYIEEFIDACHTVAIDCNSGCNWISVKDRLPEREQLVLAYNVGMCESKEGMRICHGWSASKIATHWMPLPEPPKEE